ncbi:MAG: nuclear pore complex subunit [Salinivirgaceae bacterium]|nr:MAG: nuclear pore complex subunit [Salinivirgaceae bacterium]
MSIYIHDGTSDLQSITLDKSDATFEIAGASFPEDARDFYEPVLDWIDEYSNDPLDELCLCFKLTYYNTSSSKIIHSIFEKFETIYDKGSKLKIKWYYEEDDEDMYEAGLGYKDRIEIPFELIEM